MWSVTTQKRYVPWFFGETLASLPVMLDMCDWKENVHFFGMPEAPHDEQYVTLEEAPSGPVKGSEGFGVEMGVEMEVEHETPAPQVHISPLYHHHMVRNIHGPIMLIGGLFFCIGFIVCAIGMILFAVQMFSADPFDSGFPVGMIVFIVGFGIAYFGVLFIFVLVIGCSICGRCCCAVRRQF